MQWNHNELLALQDYELIMEAREAVIDEIRNSKSEEDLEKISEIRFYLITASMFDLEMQNGGLCQFLANQGKFHGAMLENALLAFGAAEHSRIFTEFCAKNAIDLSKLEELLPETTDPYQVMENYRNLMGKYPFTDFDEAYFALDGEYPLERMLGAYIRKHMTLFFGN